MAILDSNVVKGLTLLIFIVIVVVGGITIINFMNPYFLAQDGKELATIPGDAEHFDPILNYPKVRELAGPTAKIYSLDAINVKSDGTLDMTATYQPAPTVTYEFFQETDAPANAAPVGASDNASGKYFKRVSILVAKPGETLSSHVTTGGFSFNYYYTTLGMTKSSQDPEAIDAAILQPDPGCSFKDLWGIAEQHGANKNAVAHIEYGNFGYRFRITGSEINLNFGNDCRLKN